MKKKDKKEEMKDFLLEDYVNLPDENNPFGEINMIYRTSCMPPEIPPTPTRKDEKKDEE